MNTARLLETLDAASVRCLETVVHVLWQGSLVALVIGGVLLCLRHAGARARYGVALAGLLLMAACPVGTAVWLSRTAASVILADRGDADLDTAPLPSEERIPLRVNTPADDIAPAQAPHAAPGEAAIQRSDDASPSPAMSWWNRLAPIITGVYALGVVLLLARLTLGLHGGRRLCRQAQPVADASLLAALARQVRALGPRAAPVLAGCPRVVVPTIVGILKPTILLPLSVIAGLTPSELETILTHELAHLRRYDHLVNLLQRLIEAFLFFHPAVWWLSSRIRVEREHCCDDMVIALGAPRSAYAASLLHVAEIAHTERAQVMIEGLYATRPPSALRRRIARILRTQDEPAVRLMRAWPFAVAFALSLLLIVPAFVPSDSQPMLIHAATDPQADKPDWGEAAGGLRMRVLPVAPKTDEQKPDASAPTVTRFAQPEAVTFIVEVQNVSDKPIALLGTRYGDGISPPWPGKSATDTFAPHLFECEWLDKGGKPLDQPVRKLLEGDMMLNLSSGLAETIAPGKALVCLVRPTHWNPATARLLPAGDYQARVRYHGPTPAVLQQLKRHWPDKPESSVWTGDVAAGVASFTIADAPENRRPELVWGPAHKGLQAAAVYKSAARTPQERQDTASATFPHGTRLKVEYLVKNVSDKEIAFWSETWRQDDHTFLIDAAGKETELKHGWYSGWTPVEHWTLKPGQFAVLNAISLGIADVGQGEKGFDLPIGGIIGVKPGEVKLRHELRFNSWRRGEGPGAIPGKDDWQDTLVTGSTPITVRARRAEDEAPTFTAHLCFQSPDGKLIASGHADVLRQSGMRSLLKSDFTAGALDVPQCPFEVLIVDVRAPGFEEARFYDVAVEPNRVITLTLKPAEPLRFRLVTSAGRPVVGAKVRYFNRSKAEASAGPYPTQGLQGPIWATSNADGDVVLDALQKFDPNDRKLGNNIYWFYIEPPNLAPFFVGPVEAGQDLGKLTVSPLLEVRGEVRGTPAELAAFAAEWDQPEPMKRGNGADSWTYAQSKPLTVKREGDKLTFHLTGLRPGTLRIISRFQQGGKPISHEFAKRTPTDDDVVFELNLKGPRNDLVLTSKGQDGKKP